MSATPSTPWAKPDFPGIALASSLSRMSDEVLLYVGLSGSERGIEHALSRVVEPVHTHRSIRLVDELDEG